MSVNCDSDATLNCRLPIADFLWCILTRGEYMRRLILFSTAALTLGFAFASGVRAGSGVRADRRRLQARAELADAPAGRFLRSEDTASAPRRTGSASRGAARDRWRRQYAASRGTGPDQSTGHFRSRDRSERSHLCLQPRREAGHGVQRRRQARRLWRRPGAERQEARSELAALRRGRLGRQRLHDRARRASHRQAQPENGQGAAAARHDDGEGQ